MANDRIRVTRTIIVEGPKAWVNTTLEKSFLQPSQGRVAMPIGGYLEELERVVQAVEVDNG